MRRLVFIAVFITFRLSSFGQLNIGSYPINFEDDTQIEYSVDYIDKEILDEVSAHAIWDISDSESPLVEDVLITRNGRFDDSGDIYEISNGKEKVFFRKYKKQFDEIGFELLTANYETKMVRYYKPLAFATSDLIYGATSSDSTSFDIDLNRDELPRQFKEVLPRSISSIKLRGNIRRDYHCDAHGNFSIDNLLVPALRIKVIQNFEIKLYDKGSGDEIPFINDQIKSILFDGVGKTTYYLYYSNVSKHYFAKAIESDESNGYILKFQKDNIKANPIDFNIERETFYIYPNPTYGDLKVFVNNYKRGKFNLDLYNIIGKKIWHKELTLSGREILRYDFSFLRKGTYLLSISDEYGNNISVRKLIILSI